MLSRLKNSSYGQVNYALAQTAISVFGGIWSLGVALARSDAVSIRATGKSWFQVPPITQVTLTGTLSPSVTGKDVIIVLSWLFPAHVLNHSVEFVGREETTARISFDRAYYKQTCKLNGWRASQW